MTKKRDYKAEYAKRKANAKARGLSSSQGSGHAKRGEVPVSKLKSKNDTSLIEQAIRSVRKGATISQSSKEHKISQAKIKSYMKDKNIIVGKTYVESGKTYKTGPRKGQPILKQQTGIIYDNRIREWTATIDGTTIKLDDLQSRKYGTYLNDVQKALKHNTDEPLRRWQGQSVTTVDGRRITLSADLKKIKTALSGPATFGNPNPYIFD